MCNKHKRIIKPKTFVIPLIILYQVVFNASVGIAWILPSNPQIIPPGVTVNGKKIGDMKREHAISYLDTLHIEKALDKDIILTDGSREWVLHTKEYSFRYDHAKTVDAALAQTQWHGSDRILNSLKLQARNLDIPFELAWDKEKLDDFLQSINRQIMEPARDSSLEYIDGAISLTAEKIGKEIDVKMLTDRIIHGLQHNQTAPIHIDKQPVFPRIYLNDLKKIDSDLAYFATDIPNNEEANRYHNILLTVQMLNGTIIMPSEIFSFNEKVGERNAEIGFKKAPIIIGTKVRQDLGGGICQVASTLYNASLLAGLEIVERSPHTVPVKYVPTGKDATVFFGLIDLKIRNDLANPVAIQCDVDNRQVKMRILGSHQDLNRGSPAGAAGAGG